MFKLKGVVTVCLFSAMPVILLGALVTGQNEAMAESNDNMDVSCSFWGESAALSCDGNNCLVCTSSGRKTYCTQFRADECPP